MSKDIKAKEVTGEESQLVQDYVGASQKKKNHEKLMKEAKDKLMPFVIGIGEYEIRLVAGKDSIKITERKDLNCSSDFDKALNVLTVLGSFDGLVKDVSFKIDKKVLESLNEEQKTALKEYIQEKKVAIWTAEGDDGTPE